VAVVSFVVNYKFVVLCLLDFLMVALVVEKVCATVLTSLFWRYDSTKMKIPNVTYE